MGFWGKLGKIGLAAAPFAAIPFTGGASAGLSGMFAHGALRGGLSLASKAAPILAGMAGSRAAGHQEAAHEQLNYDALNLRRAGMENENQQQDFQNQMLLNRIAMGRTAHADHPRANVVHFFNPSTMPALPSAPKFNALPGVAPPPQSGFMDKLLSAAAPASAFAGLFQKPINVGQIPGGPEQYPYLSQQGPLDPRRLPGQLPGMA